jgi:hypothetical protein
MGDLTQYRERVAEYARLANQAEGEQKYKIAYDYYVKALDIFSHMITCKSIAQCFRKEGTKQQTNFR